MSATKILVDNLLGLSIAKQLIPSVTDWNNRDDIKAMLKVNIILLLSAAGYPPKIHDEVFREILEQAENFKKHSITHPYSPGR